MRVGVFALQGDVREHLQLLTSLGVESIEVRNAEHLASCDGLIIPGGESTTISVPDNVTIKLSWFKDIDFDLAVLYKSTDGRKGIIYFGNKGTLDAFPFIKLDKDEMYDGEKLKEETIEIKKLDEMEELFIICWDFSNKGGSSAFSDSNVNVSIVDSNGNSTTAILRSESGFDSACVAKISNKKGIYNFSNLSKSFKRDMNPQNLYEILK